MPLAGFVRVICQLSKWMVSTITPVLAIRTSSRRVPLSWRTMGKPHARFDVVTESTGNVKCCTLSFAARVVAAGSAMERMRASVEGALDDGRAPGDETWYTAVHGCFLADLK